MADLVRHAAGSPDAEAPIPQNCAERCHSRVRQAIEIMLRETSDPVEIE